MEANKNRRQNRIANKARDKRAKTARIHRVGKRA